MSKIFTINGIRKITKINNHQALYTFPLKSIDNKDIRTSSIKGYNHVRSTRRGEKTRI
jgi:hypothetical protein